MTRMTKAVPPEERDSLRHEDVVRAAPGEANEGPKTIMTMKMKWPVKRAPCTKRGCRPGSSSTMLTDETTLHLNTKGMRRGGPVKEKVANATATGIETEERRSSKRKSSE